MRMGSRCLGALFISTNVEMWKTQKKKIFKHLDCIEIVCINGIGALCNL